MSIKKIVALSHTALGAAIYTADAGARTVRVAACEALSSLKDMVARRLALAEVIAGYSKAYMAANPATVSDKVKESAGNVQKMVQAGTRLLDLGQVLPATLRDWRPYAASFDKNGDVKPGKSGSAASAKPGGAARNKSNKDTHGAHAEPDASHGDGANPINRVAFAATRNTLAALVKHLATSKVTLPAALASKLTAMDAWLAYGCEKASNT